jgi:hypothetical protein
MDRYDAQGTFYKAETKPVKEGFGILNDGLRVCPPNYAEAYPEPVNFKEKAMVCCPEMTVWDAKRAICVGQPFSNIVEPAN